jgi:phenylalanyl-tRNA synthetase alpha chain
MEQLLKQIEDIKKEITAAEAANAAALEEFRIKYLGTKGLVKQIMGEMKNVPNDQKKEFGQILNAFKIVAEEKFEALQAGLGDSAETDTGMDFSLPGDPTPVGTRHPLNLVRNQMVSIFKRLGFAVAEGPEIEDDWHNFGAMNLPEDHPARDMQDTFYVEEKTADHSAWLLRTHTSSTQARVMESQKSALLFPSSRRIVYRRKCKLRRFKTNTLFFRTRNVWQRSESTFSPKLFSIHRTKCRDGYQLSNLCRQGM